MPPYNQSFMAGWESGYRRIPPAFEFEEGTMINDFKVGCDPEFILLKSTGMTDPASNYFGQEGPIGYDHGGRVAEFRPAPTYGALPIIRKIQDMITQITQAVPRRFRAGAICNDDCLGGHVHFGFDCFAQKPTRGLGVLHGGLLNERGKKVVWALDALTKVLEHLDILPANESARRRASAQGRGNYYGAYGDVRDCNGHMEYRTMASWLYDPKVAYLCLTAAKLAASEPAITYAALKDCQGFNGLKNWLAQAKEADIDVKRTVEKLLDKGLAHLQVDPTVDFKERWGELGL